MKFTYDGRGLKPGHVEEGKFTVVCTPVENMNCHLRNHRKPYVMTTHGKVQSTDDFKKAAVKIILRRQDYSAPEIFMPF